MYCGIRHCACDVNIVVEIKTLVHKTGNFEMW